MVERWTVVGEHPNHIVSDQGRVRHRRVNAPILKGYVDADGYRRVRLDGKEHRVHRLVCAAFQGPCPEGMECAHKDGVRLNNIASNLRWATRSENTLDQIRHGTFSNNAPKGTDHKSAKLTKADVIAIRHAHSGGESGRSLARRYGLTSANISRLLRGDTWKSVPQGCAQTPPDLSSRDTNNVG